MQEQSGSLVRTIALAFIGGVILGGAAGLLLAPKAGSDLRGAIGEQARNWGNTASEQYKRASETAGQWADRGREFVDKARDAVSRGADEARSYASGTTSGSSYGSGNTGNTGGTTDFGRS